MHFPYVFDGCFGATKADMSSCGGDKTFPIWPFTDVCSALIQDRDLLPCALGSHSWFSTASRTPTLKRDRDIPNGTPEPHCLGSRKCEYARHSMNQGTPATNQKTDCPGRVEFLARTPGCVSENKLTTSPHVAEEESGTGRPILNRSSRRPRGVTWGSRRRPRALAPCPVSEVDSCVCIPGINEIRLSRRETRLARGTCSINVSYRESPISPQAC